MRFECSHLSLAWPDSSSWPSDLGCTKCPLSWPRI
uniref:Uncharacterized protein n=1 Tax=Anguilla anguilla TaxID=7936 RepID=A0A0E9U3D6_ANGAN